MNIDPSYKDPEQFNNNQNDKLDYKFILMRQIDKVRLSRSTEMRGGYHEDKPIAMGGGITTIRVYVSDTRETYINSVKSLKSLLIVYWDKTFEEEIEKFTKKFNELDKNDKIEEDDKSKEIVNTYDLIFEQLMKLCVRAKLIGGADSIEDTVQ